MEMVVRGGRTMIGRTKLQPGVLFCGQSRFFCAGGHVWREGACLCQVSLVMYTIVRMSIQRTKNSEIFVQLYLHIYAWYGVVCILARHFLVNMFDIFSLSRKLRKTNFQTHLRDIKQMNVFPGSR